MTKYILTRLVFAVPVLLGVTLVVFIILSLIPGDPATAILGSYATPENVERLNAQLGLDKIEAILNTGINLQHNFLS